MPQTSKAQSEELFTGRSTFDATTRDPFATAFFEDVVTDRGAVAVLDWFLPKSARPLARDALRRARLTIAVSFVSGCAVCVTLAGAADEPDSFLIRVVSYGLAAVLLATPFLVRAGVPVRWIGHGMLVVIAGYTWSLAAATGGADTGGFFLAVLAPIHAVLLLGPRPGLVWSVAIGLGMASIAIGLGLGFEPVVFPDQAVAARWAFWGCIAGMTGTCAVVLTYESLQERTLVRLLEATDVARREHERRLALEAGFREDLERLVAERTAELVKSREQLRQADRLASIGTLAAGVAHQINNPVGSILLGAQVALAEVGHEDAERRFREALEQNVDDAKRCGEIVRRLLRFARPGAGAHEEVDLNEVVARAHRAHPAREATVHVELCDTPLRVRANAVELEQVVLNLLINAAQAGAGRITVTTRRFGDLSTLEIRDDGHGIEEKDRVRLFDPFFTTRTAEGGSGLGLSVAHKIVEDHGGRIDVDSKVGSGTRFSIELPLVSRADESGAR